jgi:SpoIIAA-like
VSKAAAEIGGETMSVQQLSSTGSILCFKVTGTLTRAELGSMQAAAVASLGHSAKVNALVILENFLGWEKASGWEDTSFADDYDPSIEKMAIVGPEEWRDWVCAFAGKGFRPVAIEYFLPLQLDEARAWLSNNTPSSQ